MKGKPLLLAVLFISLSLFFWAGPVEGSQQLTIHKVERGESLYRVSRAYDTSIDRLMELNPLHSKHWLVEGQVLVVPGLQGPPGTTRYQVQPGDTLYKIALEHGLAVEMICRQNSINNPHYIYAGQVLWLPLPQLEAGVAEDISKDQAPAPKRPPSLIPQLLREFPETLFLRGRTDRKQVALTFDDGLDGIYTPALLNLLAKYQVPATFFVIGANSEMQLALLKRLVGEGHVVGNHTWSHPNLRYAGESRVLQEIQRTEDMIYAVVDKRTALLRPPYGDLSRENMLHLRDGGYTVVNWSVDSRDWEVKSYEGVLVNMLPDITNGSIILLHNSPQLAASSQELLPAVEDLIYTLVSQGYQFVTVDELLHVPAYQ